MSYILDALKKADAERERGGVPGLHTRQITPGPSLQKPPRSFSQWVVLVGALVLTIVVVVWWEVRAPDTGVGTLPAAVMQPVTPAPLVAAPAPAVSVPSVVTPPPPIVRPEPRAPVKQPPLAPSNAQTAPPASTPAVPAAPAPLLGELPVEVRSQIPALAISGSVYSDNPSQRLLLINGQVLSQGSTVAQDVTLMEIQRGSSEFSFRGTRFRVTH
jgi:general secretion pathway protein B